MMVKAPDDLTNQIYCRLVSEDGKIEMGVHPVLFGYRVRAGWVGDQGVMLDWCCGAKQEDVELMFTCMKLILDQRTNFDGIPERSDPKPFFKDVEFMKKVIELIPDNVEFDKIKLPPVETFRHQAFESLGL